MKLGSIITAAEEVKSSSGYRNPEDLCAEAGIIPLLFPMGTAKRSIKGFILSHNGNVAVTVNSDLPEDVRRVVWYHEFAHYILHVKTGRMESIRDCDIYDASSEAEYEANLLAAELQLGDDEVLEALRSTDNFYMAASELRVPPELLDFKMRLMREKGYRIPETPVQAAGSYLYSYEGA